MNRKKIIFHPENDPIKLDLESEYKEWDKIIKDYFGEEDEK